MEEKPTKVRPNSHQVWAAPEPGAAALMGVLRDVSLNPLLIALVSGALMRSSGVTLGSLRAALEDAQRSLSASARHEAVADVHHLAIERQRFDRPVRDMENRSAGRLVDAA